MALLSSFTKAVKKGGELAWDAAKFDTEWNLHVTEGLLKGEFSEMGRDFNDMFGEHQRTMTSNLGDMGFDEDEDYVKNSDAVAAAIVAWFVGGAAAGGSSGAEGAGAAGGTEAGVAGGGVAGAEGGVVGGAEGGVVGGAEGGVTGGTESGTTGTEGGGVDWMEMVEKYGGMMQGGGGGGGNNNQQQQQQPSYANMIGRLNRIVEKVDPFDEIGSMQVSSTPPPGNYSPYSEQAPLPEEYLYNVRDKY